MTLDEKLEQLQAMAEYCWCDEFAFAVEVVNELIEKINELEGK